MDERLRGTVIDGTHTSKMFDGAVFPYRIFVPDIPADEFALVVGHDFLNEGEALAMQELAKTGEAPACIFIGVIPAKLPATLDGGFERGLRMNTYDVFSDKYPNFIVDELVPALTKEHGLKISESPDMHMASGGSSGGISAWNMAWERNDYFRRVYMSSPSFLSMARGDEMVNLIRKCETKPIRVFVDYSEDEPDCYFGSSFCVAEASIRALRYAGYEMMSDYHPGEGHCSRHTSYEDALVRMRFLWKDWQTEPVTVKKFSERVERVVSVGDMWEWCDGDFCDRVTVFPMLKGYVHTDKEVILLPEENGGKGTVVADGFDAITRIRLSSDKWRMYIADKRRGCVYATTINPDGTLGGVYTHGALHHKTDFRYPGAFDICVDNEDRVYAATEIGIQCIRSFGLIDVILENPCGRHADKITVGNDGYLYAVYGHNCYRRKLNGKAAPHPTEKNEPKQVWYYD